MQYFHFMALPRWFGVLSRASFEWGRGWLQRLTSVRQRPVGWAARPAPATGLGVAQAAHAWQAHGLAAGFDLARAQYAAGVRAGLIERSLLASGAFERRLALLERLTLGPWARRV